MIFSKDDEELIKINFKNNMNFEKRVAIPESMFDMKLVGNGDALINSDYYIDDFDENPDETWYGEDIMNDGCWFKMIYMDFDKCEGINEDSQVDSYPAIDMELEPQNIHQNIKSNLVSGNSSKKTKSGFYDLLLLKEELTKYNLISNKDMKMPYVFENKKIEQHEEFYKDLEDNIKWKGKLYAGTINGNCFLVDFSVSKQGKLNKRTYKLLEKGKPFSHPDVKNKIVEDKTIENNMGTFSNQVIKTREEKRKMTYKVHDCKLFLEENVEIVVLGESTSNVKNQSRKCVIYARRAEVGEWVRTEFSTDHRYNFYESSYFSVFRMNNTRRINESKFYLVSTIGMAVFTFNKDEGELKVLKYLKKYISDSSLLAYSHSQNLFYIPNKNIIQVWNETLNFSTYKMEFDWEILRVFISENDTQQSLLVYDDGNYYEIDLVTLNFKRKIKIIDPSVQTRIMPFNLNVYTKNTPFAIPLFKEEIFGISFIANMETLNLKEFPFHYLKLCFSKEDYIRPIKQYASYYFKKLQKLNFKDIIYGPLNPLFFAIYHNDMTLLEDLLDHYRYPQQIKEYWSPLAFSFIYNYNSAVKVFCDRLIKRNYTVRFSRFDFQYLLNSPFSYCHKLMATIPSEPTLQNFPRLLYMRKAVQLHYVQEVGHLLFAMKNQERRHLARISKKKKKKKMSNILQKQIGSQKKSITKSEVVSFQIPFKYSYKVGTPDSVKFLDTFSQSNTEEFILSEWKEVIIDKWSRHRLIHILLAILYWVFTLVTTLSMIFFRRIFTLEIVSLSFIAFFILFEFLQVISYTAFNIKRFLNFHFLI